VEIREKLGLCYMIRSSLNIYEQQGNLMIQSGVDRKRFPLAMERIVDELQKIKTGGVTQKELDDAKTCLKGKMDLSFEDSEEMASWYGVQDILLKRVVEPEQRIQEINAVTTDDVLKVAKMLFEPKNAACAVIGPKSVINQRKLKSYFRTLSLS
ncbi:MAG: insulinase family protein, partial [Candidatus Kerfeldbacteria bacterium]|nr:insulinase family protein [Candidatus Kerfeldbacteria bacterium]